MRTGNVRGFSLRPGNQRPQTCPGAENVRRTQSDPRKKLNQRRKDIINVAWIRVDPFEGTRVVGVRCADDQPFAPGNYKQQSLTLCNRNRFRHVQSTALDYDVDAFREAELHAAVRQVLRPWATCIDYGARAQG